MPITDPNAPIGLPPADPNHPFGDFPTAPLPPGTTPLPPAGQVFIPGSTKTVSDYLLCVDACNKIQEAVGNVGTDAVAFCTDQCQGVPGAGSQGIPGVGPTGDNCSQCFYSGKGALGWQDRAVACVDCLATRVLGSLLFAGLALFGLWLFFREGK